MDIQSCLEDMEAAVQRVADGLEAVEMIAIGMDGMNSQYAGSVYAIWRYLADANKELSKCLTACLDAV